MIEPSRAPETFERSPNGRRYGRVAHRSDRKKKVPVISLLSGLISGLVGTQPDTYQALLVPLSGNLKTSLILVNPSLVHLCSGLSGCDGVARAAHAMIGARDVTSRSNLAWFSKFKH